ETLRPCAPQYNEVLNTTIEETFRFAPSTFSVSPFRTSRSIEPPASRCQRPWLLAVVMPLPAMLARKTRPPSAGAQNWVNLANFTLPGTLGGGSPWRTTSASVVASSPIQSPNALPVTLTPPVPLSVARNPTSPRSLIAGSLKPPKITPPVSGAKKLLRAIIFSPPESFRNTAWFSPSRTPPPESDLRKATARSAFTAPVIGFFSLAPIGSIVRTSFL